MLKVVAFMRQVANGCKMGKTWDGSHIAAALMPLLFCGKEISLLIK